MVVDGIEHNIVLMSGFDSLITRHYVETNYPDSKLDCVYCSLGHRYEKEEAHYLGSGVEILKGLDCLGLYHEQEDAHIPFRNAFIVLLAAYKVEKGSNTVIWLTTQKDEMSLNDRSYYFYQAITNLLEVLGLKVTVMTPWLLKDKTEMVQWYIENGGRVEELKKSWSCYRPVDLEVPCGDCPACIRRYIAMTLNGIKEEYAVDPKKSNTALSYIESANKGVYSVKRNERILKALK